MKEQSIKKRNGKLSPSISAQRQFYQIFNSIKKACKYSINNHDLGKKELSKRWFDKANKYFENFLKIMEILKLSDPDSSENDKLTSLTYKNMADMYNMMRDYPLALGLYLDSLKIREKYIQYEPDILEHQIVVSELYENMGDVYYSLRETDKSLDSYKKSLKILNELFHQDPGSDDIAVKISHLFKKLDRGYIESNEQQKSLDHYHVALQIVTELQNFHNHPPDYINDLIFIHYRLGELYLQLEQPQIALNHFEEVVQQIKYMSDHFNKSVMHYYNLSWSYLDIGAIYVELGNSQKALVQYHEALVYFKKFLKNPSLDTSYRFDYICGSKRFGNLKNDFVPILDLEIHSLIHKIKITLELKWRESNSLDFCLDIAKFYIKFGDFCMTDQRCHLYMNFYQAALNIAEYLCDSDSQNSSFAKFLSFVHCKFGAKYLNLTLEKNKALFHYETSLKILELLFKRFPDSESFSYDISIAHEKLGDVNMKLKSVNQALIHYKTSFKIRSKLCRFNYSEKYHMGLSSSHEKLGDICLELNKSRVAEKQYNISLNIRKEMHTLHPENVNYTLLLIDLYKKLEDNSFSNDNVRRNIEYEDERFKLADQVFHSTKFSEKYAIELADEYFKSGFYYIIMSDISKALKRYQSRLLILKKLCDYNPHNYEYTQKYFNTQHSIKNLYDYPHKDLL